MNSFDKAMKFVNDAIKKGYRLDGSVFKIDYSASGYNVGFWLRPPLVKLKNGEWGYEMPHLVAKAKDKDFDIAVEKALTKVKERMQNE